MKYKTKLFGADAFRNFDASQLPFDSSGWGSDAPLFERLIRLHRPQLIVEVGSWKGGSAITMGNACRKHGLDCEIICVDSWSGAPEFWINTEDPERYGSLGLKYGYPQVYYQFLSNIFNCGLADLITPLPVPSTVACKILSKLGAQADLIYIDASHDYENVLIDLTSWIPLLRPGGVIFGDDYDEYWPSVKGAVNDFVARFNLHLEVFDSRNWAISHIPKAISERTDLFKASMRFSGESPIFSTEGKSLPRKMSSSEPTISLYTVYHKPTHVFSTETIVPIQVGSSDSIPGIGLRDMIGENIADKNSSYCELTAIYWAWKNDLGSDYIGLMHYRRLFDFSCNNENLESKWGVIEEAAVNESLYSKYGWSDDQIRTVVLSNDVILPIPWDVLHSGGKNLREQYAKSEHHNESDIIHLRSVIARVSPEYLEIFDKVFEGRAALLTNMFICRRNIFHDYCEWLFPILEKFEEEIDLSKYKAQERRVTAYLGERLLHIWFSKTFDDNPSLRVSHIPRVLIHDTTPINGLHDLIDSTAEKCIVVTASDDNFCPHVATLACSIFENRSSNREIEIIVLESDIHNENKKKLRDFVSNYSNCSINFINVLDHIKNLDGHMHITKETYARLLLPDVLKDCDKVVYLDADTILNTDVCKLFDQDVTDYSAAVVYDYIVHAFCLSEVLSSSGTGRLPSKTYFSDYLGLGDKWQSYFQAGVIVFNLKRLRDNKLLSNSLEIASSKKFWLGDQDILNVLLQDEVRYLDARWNAVTMKNDLISSLPPDLSAEIRCAQSSPSIIHYAGEDKPWINQRAYMSDYYWQYLKKTPFYDDVIFQTNNRDATPNSGKRKSFGGSLMRLPKRLKNSFTKRVRKIISR